ncbi:MAG: hypothetical protein M4D80_05265 [Myxococcota bacterium]|nr:hypothetical protein [Myxococcota bacterium]
MTRFALLLTFVAACAGVGPKYAGEVRVADSRLVPINPDVKTVIDADQPVFFAQGSYWLFHDGKWFRADRVGTTWEYVENPPVPVQQIEQPYAYVHYRKDGTGKEIETVAAGFQGQNAGSINADDQTKSRPAKERQPAAVDPSVDPAVNLAPAR